MYLHCDPTASHHLKQVMDAILGRSTFGGEITWKRTSAHNDSARWGRVSDRIFFYGSRINSDAVRVPLNPDYVKKFYRHDDHDGKGLYRHDNLSAKGLLGNGYCYDFHGHPGPWRYPERRIKELAAAGRIGLPRKPGRRPFYKRYLAENKGQCPSDLWTDVSPVAGAAKERTGYPTQKPLALLTRIVKASSRG